jgi:hypothetical protein
VLVQGEQPTVITEMLLELMVVWQGEHAAFVAAS